jgi:hypothetical protein
MEIACIKHIIALREPEIESKTLAKQVLYYIFFSANIVFLRQNISGAAIFHHTRNFCP